MTWLKRDGDFSWVYPRLWDTISRLNRESFDVEVTDFERSIQLSAYDSGESGFYDWHMDVGRAVDSRKLSVVLQLSDPGSYDGGEVRFFNTCKEKVAERGRGTLLLFSSFFMHKVTPVTRGTRCSLVSWISGPSWR